MSNEENLQNQAELAAASAQRMPVEEGELSEADLDGVAGGATSFGTQPSGFPQQSGVPRQTGLPPGSLPPQNQFPPMPGVPSAQDVPKSFPR